MVAKMIRLPKKYLNPKYIEYLYLCIKYYRENHFFPPTKLQQKYSVMFVGVRTGEYSVRFKK